jgi:hypothetical protein
MPPHGDPFHQVVAVVIPAQAGIQIVVAAGGSKSTGFRLSPE